MTIDGMNVTDDEREEAEECQADVSCSAVNTFVHRMFRETNQPLLGELNLA
jgi:hypothetical protein